MGSKGDREGLQPAPGSSPGCRYAIRVEGHLDAHWSEWLEGTAIIHEEGRRPTAMRCTRWAGPR